MFWIITNPATGLPLGLMKPPPGYGRLGLLPDQWHTSAATLDRNGARGGWPIYSLTLGRASALNDFTLIDNIQPGSLP